MTSPPGVRARPCWQTVPASPLDWMEDRGRRGRLRGDESAVPRRRNKPCSQRRSRARSRAGSPSNQTPGPNSRPRSPVSISILRNTCVPPPRCSGRASGKTASSPSRARRLVPSGPLRARNTRRRTWPARWRKHSPPTRPQDSSQRAHSAALAWTPPGFAPFDSGSMEEAAEDDPPDPSETGPDHGVDEEAVRCRRRQRSLRRGIQPRRRRYRGGRRPGGRGTRPCGRCDERGPHRGRESEGDRAWESALANGQGSEGDRHTRIPARRLTRSSKHLRHGASQATACGALFRFHVIWSP